MNALQGYRFTHPDSYRDVRPVFVFNYSCGKMMPLYRSTTGLTGTGLWDTGDMVITAWFLWSPSTAVVTKHPPMGLGTPPRVTSQPCVPSPQQFIFFFVRGWW